MNHFLHRSCLITPVLLGLLAWSNLPGVFDVDNAANAAQPKKAASTETQQTKTSEPSTATLESQQFSSITHPVGEVIYGFQFSEFKPELTALKERVDQLQAQNATLKSQQFSTTTKIQGQVVITFQNGF